VNHPGRPLDDRLVPLTDGQQAALAKVACALSRPDGVAILCGPGGVGKSTVLAQVAAALRATRPVSLVRGRWLTDGDMTTHDEVRLVDDAHEADERTLASLAAATTGPLVLSGQGRLLTLVARVHDLERVVSLRAVLHPFTIEDTARLLARERLVVEGDEDRSHCPIVRTIHEISGGIPLHALRLARLAAVMAGSQPGGRLHAADIERLHRRLSPLAA
jgi:type II secretory pathway predicted ATPase ExeA